MALADFFLRDVIAISQVLHGFQRDAFLDELSGLSVSISFGEDVTKNSDGRELLDLTIRLVARLYPSLVLFSVPTAEQIADDMISLARSTNPNLEVSKTGTANVNISIGTDAPTVEIPTVYAGCDGWFARVGTVRPYSCSNLDNPFGAGLAACLATANVFRYLFLPDGPAKLDTDICFPSDAGSFPDLKSTTLNDPLVLFGVGAIGNSASWAFARTPFCGQIHLVDPEDVELSNLQRYVLCTRSDEGNSKVDTVAEKFAGTLKALPHRGTLASFLVANGYKWERIAVALDSAHDRKAVQRSLPRWVANAWTQLDDLGVSSHEFLGQGACLACLYLPTEESPSEDQIVAEGLKIPHLRDRVRVLLGSGSAIDRAICEAVADRWGIPAEDLDRFVGSPIRDLWVDGICGGGIMPLGEAGRTPTEQQVPLAFQSALAGILLAANTVHDVLTDGTQRKTEIRRVDVMKPLGDSSPHPRPKDGTRTCICEDPDFIDTYITKYGN